jgi:hypothetical protein
MTGDNFSWCFSARFRKCYSDLFQVAVEVGVEIFHELFFFGWKPVAVNGLFHPLLKYDCLAWRWFQTHTLRLFFSGLNLSFL